MKKTLLAVALCCLPTLVLAAQTPVTTIDKFNSPTTTINNLREATNTKLGVIEANRQDHVTNIAGKADKSATVMLWSAWADGVSFTTTSPPVAYNGGIYKCVAPYTKVAGETPDTQTGYFAEVTGSGGGIAHATSDGSYYASRNGAWSSLTEVFAAPLGTDDNYVTDAEKTKIGNLSGTNTGDQDLSGYALTSAVLSKTNTTAFTPTADYHPVPKKYVDDEITATVGAGPTLSVSSPLDLNETTGVLSITANSYQAYDADLTSWAAIPPATGTINTTGAVQGKIPFNSYATATTLTSATHNSTIVQMTVAGEITLWDCETAGVGDTIMLWARDAEKIEVVPASGDHFALFAGTALTADYELDMAATAGTKATLMCTADDTWSVYSETAASTDGGAAD